MIDINKLCITLMNLWPSVIKSAYLPPCVDEDDVLLLGKQPPVTRHTGTSTTTAMRERQASRPRADNARSLVRENGCLNMPKDSACDGKDRRWNLDIQNIAE